MHPSSIALQYLARLPSLTLQKMSTIGQGLKHRIADIWKKASDFFKETTLWQVMMKPSYERYIKPLETLDLILLSGGILSIPLITLLAANLFGFATIPLGVAAGASLLGIAHSITRRRVEYYFEKEARKEVEKIRDAIHIITHENRSFEPVQKARENLRKDEFDHLSKDWEELDRQLNVLRNSVVSDNLGKTEKTLVENKKTALTYLESLLKKLDPYQVVKPLGEPFVRASGHPLPSS